MISVLAFIFASGSVCLLGWVILGVARQTCRKYQEFYRVDSMGSITEMMLLVDARQTFVLGIGAMCLLGAFDVIVFNWVMGAFGALVGLVLPAIAIRWFRRRRIRLFNAQLIGALSGLANALKAGLSFPQAMSAIAADSSPPLSLEFALFTREMKLGLGLEDALVNMGRRVGSEDLDLMVVSTNIARSLGGNLAEIFETISATIQERFRLEGKIEAMTAQGRLQGWIVAAMPGALGVALNAMRPDLMAPMLHHAFGWVLLALMVLMEGLGILLIRRIVNVEV